MIYCDTPVGCSGHISETLGKVALASKAQPISNGNNIHRCPGQKCFCLVDLHLIDVINQGAAYFLLKFFVR